MSQVIGFIGLGAIGEGMADNLLKAGHEVRGVDVRPEALTRLTKAGGTAAKTPAEAADGADALLVTVFDVDQAREVLFGEHGAAETLPEGAVIAMHVTMAPDEVRALAREAEQRGYLFVDAPVTGGVVGAEAGTLTIMTGGSDAALAAADPAFQAMSAKIARCGAEPGSAATVKAINQLMVGAQVALASEAMALAARAGADPNIVFEVVGSGAARSAVWDSRVPDMIAGEFSPKGVLDIFVKDLKIVLDTGRASGAYTPLAASALQLFQAASASGRGRDNDSSLVTLYEALNQQTVKDAAKR